ncbi:MAG: hypothetical protein ACFB0G_21980 [Leptolyngbyaceae cyanobacterium]
MSTFEIKDPDYDFNMSQYFGRGWELFKANALPFVGFTLLTIVIAIVLSAILPYPLGSGDPEAGQVGGNVVVNILSPLLSAGFYIVALQIARNRPTTFGDFFQGFSRVVPILLLSIVSTVFIVIGFFLLVLPGIYLAVSYVLSVPLLLDKSLDFWPAMETSRKLVGKKWFAFFGFVLVLGLVNIVGALLVGLGLLVTIPWTVCTVTAAYEDIVGLNSVAEAA